MAGKITFKAGTHPSREGGWATPVALSPEHVSNLRATLGRDLTDAECLMIARTLTTIQCVREAMAGDAVTHQEIKETLTAIAKADDTEVQQAFNDCDDTTESLIQDAIAEQMQIEFSTWHPPERIRAAAKLALCALATGKAGPKIKGYRIVFAKAVPRLWQQLGCTNMGIYEANEVGSPLVTFATELLKIIEPETCPSLSIVAKLLRKVSA